VALLVTPNTHERVAQGADVHSSIQAPSVEQRPESAARNGLDRGHRERPLIFKTSDGQQVVETTHAGSGEVVVVEGSGAAGGRPSGQAARRAGAILAR
jgi:hypothetical protein